LVGVRLFIALICAVVNWLERTDWGEWLVRLGLLGLGVVLVMVAVLPEVGLVIDRNPGFEECKAAFNEYNQNNLGNYCTKYLFEGKTLSTKCAPEEMVLVWEPEILKNYQLPLVRACPNLQCCERLARQIERMQLAQLLFLAACIVVTEVVLVVLVLEQEGSKGEKASLGPFAAIGLLVLAGLGVGMGFLVALQRQYGLSIKRPE
jgi:drug/metabolite transporter (DMT)-like permease